MNNSSNPQIVANNLGKTFATKNGSVTAFKNLNLAANAGEFICILGPSGCGKSSVLRTLAGLESPSSGNLQIQSRDDGTPLDVGMAFQERGIFPWMTVTQNIDFLLKNNPRIPPESISSIIENYTARVGLADFADYYPYQLSGGMQQRVSIARCFANDPDILFMDEPFVFLDYQTRMSLQTLLLDIWSSTQKTVLFVTHDIEEAVLLADRIVVMSGHPGTVKEVVDVNLPRPRKIRDMRKNVAYIEVVDKVSGLIEDELEQSLKEVG